MTGPGRAADIEAYSELYQDQGYRMGQARRQLVLDLLAPLERGSLLDVSTGRGETLQMAESLGFSVMGTEVVPALLGERVVYAEANDLPFANGAFDTVTCFDVLEHLPPDDDQGAVEEMVRVARRRALLSVANYSCVWGGIETHINRRDYAEWHRLLEAWSRRPVTRLQDAAASAVFRIEVSDD